MPQSHYLIVPFCFYFADNLWSNFHTIDQVLAKGAADDTEPQSRKIDSQVYIDITTSFTMLIGLFFPSVTGKCRIDFARLAVRKTRELE